MILYEEAENVALDERNLAMQTHQADCSSSYKTTEKTRKNCIDQKMKNQSQGVKGYHKPEIDMPPLPKIRPKKCFHSHARMYLLF